VTKTAKNKDLSAYAIDEEVEKLNNILNKAIISSCQVSYARKQYPPWWNQELAELRKISRKTFNQSCASKVWQPYKDALKAIKLALYKAKKESWA